MTASDVRAYFADKTTEKDLADAANQAGGITAEIIAETDVWANLLQLNQAFEKKTESETLDIHFRQ